MGHHIDSEGRFQSDKYPELGPDKIVVSFKHFEARVALRMLADSYQARDPELADDIRTRLRSLNEEDQAAIREQLEATATPVDRSQRVLTDGRTEEQAPDYRDLDPATGQQRSYVVLSDAERAKGFVRPVRRSYRHAGKRPTHPLRDLTAEERVGYADEGFVKFEVYPEGRTAVGRYWTQADLDSGCGAVTTMSQDIAETYARDPKFYGGTFCVGCKTHLPLEEFRWEGSDEVVGS